MLEYDTNLRVALLTYYYTARSSGESAPGAAIDGPTT